MAREKIVYIQRFPEARDMPIFEGQGVTGCLIVCPKKSGIPERMNGMKVIDGKKVNSYRKSQ